MTKIRKLDEVGAMGAIDQAMSALSDNERIRILKWAWDKFGDPKSAITAGVDATRRAGNPNAGGKSVTPQVEEDETVGDFYARASATTEQERALVVAYWVQEVRGDGEFDAQSVNKELKHLGHGVSNITRALDDLKGRKPQLVIQTQKSGKSKQARKLYKVTAAGKTEVTRMLAGESRE